MAFLALSDRSLSTLVPLGDLTPHLRRSGFFDSRSSKRSLTRIPGDRCSSAVLNGQGHFGAKAGTAVLQEERRDEGKLYSSNWVGKGKGASGGGGWEVRREMEVKVCCGDRDLKSEFEISCLSHASSRVVNLTVSLFVFSRSVSSSKRPLLSFNSFNLHPSWCLPFPNRRHRELIDLVSSRHRPQSSPP